MEQKPVELTVEQLLTIVTCGQAGITKMQAEAAYLQTRIELELATVMDAKRRLYALGFGGRI